MLNINQDIMSRLDVKMLERQRNLVKIISVLMLMAGVLFIAFPFISGDILTMILGVILICSSIIFIVIMIKNRVHNFWAVVSGILVCAAYVVMGYVFLTAPELGLFAIASFLAGLFMLGGLIRIMVWFKNRQLKGRGLQLLIGVLDLLIAWSFISAAPQASMVMVSLVVGIELIVSAFSCWALAQSFNQ